jgi:hypothetical protein
MVMIAAIALITCAIGGACSRNQYTKVTRTDGSTVIGTLVTIRPEVVVLETRQGRVEIRRSDVKSLDVPTISEIAEVEGAQADPGATARNGAGTKDPAAKNGGPGAPGSGGTGADGRGADGAGGPGRDGPGSPAGGSPGTGGSGTGGAEGGGPGGGSDSGTAGSGGAARGAAGYASGNGAAGYTSGGGAAADPRAKSAGSPSAAQGGVPGNTSGGTAAGPRTNNGAAASGAGSPGTASGNPSGGAGGNVPPGPAMIPAATAFSVTFDAPLGSDTSRLEEDVSATLIAPVIVGGTRIVPAGAVMRGRVIEATPAKDAGGRGRLAIRFHTLAIGSRTSPLDGPTAMLVAQVFTREDKRKVGIGAAAGAVLGGIVSRTKKAVGIGAAAGAGGTAAAVGARNELRLARGAKVRLQFTQAVVVPAAQ